MSAPTERHETRALLRAHLAAASGYRHLTRHCPICHRLLRLAMEPLTAAQAPCTRPEPDEPTPAPGSRHQAPGRGSGTALPPPPAAGGEEGGPQDGEQTGTGHHPGRPAGLSEDRVGDPAGDRPESRP
ncbi:DUF6274 family protein [Streptomyces sp. ALB3]|uniref:DUF6274 family protein n=1 Tax=Streptomyces sp. ALB3 TaxID=3374278 RepID=UPI0037895FDC